MKPRASSGPGAVGGPRQTESAAVSSTAIPAVFRDGGENRAAAGVLLTEPEVADRLRVSVACLRRWRLERRGPRFLKVGSLVRYPAEELNHWIESLPGGGTLATTASGGRPARGTATA
jgi:excisionase family DNA binding protein